MTEKVKHICNIYINEQTILNIDNTISIYFVFGPVEGRMLNISTWSVHLIGSQNAAGATMDNNGFGALPPVERTDGDGLHPLAVILGIVGLLVMIVVVAASSYQREKLQYMARKLLRKKVMAVSDAKQRKTCLLFLSV
jgi:hypothetical protein